MCAFFPARKLGKEGNQWKKRKMNVIIMRKLHSILATISILDAFHRKKK